MSILCQIHLVGWILVFQPFCWSNPQDSLVKTPILWWSKPTSWWSNPILWLNFPTFFGQIPTSKVSSPRSPNGWWFHPPLIPAFLHLVGGIATSHDGRDAQLARNDGGVAGTATAVGDDGTSLLPWQDFCLNIKFRLKTSWIFLERHGMPPSDMIGSQSGSVMSATSTWPCSNSPIWSMLVKMFTCRSLKMVIYGYTVIVLLGGRCFLPQAPRSYPIPMAHRVTPGHPEVTPGTKSYWHTSTTPPLVWQTKYVKCVRAIANHICNRIDSKTAAFHPNEKSDQFCSTRPVFLSWLWTWIRLISVRAPAWSYGIY